MRSVDDIAMEFSMSKFANKDHRYDALLYEIKTLREALLDTARRIEALKEPCGMDPETPTAIQNGRYASIALLIHDALNAARSKT